MLLTYKTWIKFYVILICLETAHCIPKKQERERCLHWVPKAKIYCVSISVLRGKNAVAVFDVREHRSGPKVSVRNLQEIVTSRKSGSMDTKLAFDWYNRGFL
jgi:hypothetical protein